ncbi:aminoglycoside phosphotransferase family protein [Magnetofaba australis]|nr:phosphotransferase [Magnetofaba australis]
MSSRDATRITQFVQREFPGVAGIEQVAGDASFRAYFRIHTDDGPRILMDAPPDKEDCAPFVDIARHLRAHGVHVPLLHHVDLEQGFLALEDLGDVTLLQALNSGVEAETLYAMACDQLLAMQQAPIDGSCIAHQRPYDHTLLRFEFSLLTDWYIEGILQTPISDADYDAFDEVFEQIIAALLKQPRVLVHRDYHSRNLMWRGPGLPLGVIDFQDAVVGPITYDLASLLRDCYVAWDEPFRQHVQREWLAGAESKLGYAPKWEDFSRDFDWMAIQRNLKAVGIFGRLWLRDGKCGYMDDVPRTMSYVRETLARQPELAELNALLAKYIPAGCEPSAADVQARGRQIPPRPAAQMSAT